MTVGLEIHRDAASQEASHIAEMRGGHGPQWTDGQIAHSINRVTLAENIELRTRLDLMRKSKEAAQELLEAERQKNAALQQQLLTAKHDAAITRVEWATSKDFVHSDWMKIEQAENAELRLLRMNDAATIADLERRLREAEGQLKAQRLSAAEVSEIRAYVPWATKKERARADAAAAENAEIVELRRTIDLMAKTAAEAQDNFRLIAELAADPADEKRKENTK